MRHDLGDVVVHDLTVRRCDAQVDREGQLADALEVDEGAVLRDADCGDGDVHVVRGVEHVLKIGVEFQSALTLHHALEIDGPRVFEGPLVVVAPDARVARFLADDGGELVQQHFPLAVGARAVRPVGDVMVGVGGQGLLASIPDEVEVTAIGPVVGLVPGFIELFREELGFDPGGEPLIHPFVQAFVGRQQALEPGVGHFVGGDPDQAPEVPVAPDQRAHGVFHAAIASFDHRVLLPRIGADVFCIVLHGPGSDGGKLFPGAVAGVGLVDEVQGGAAFHFEGLVHEVGVGGPGKVDDVLGDEMPVDHAFGRCGALTVAVAAVPGVLEDARSTDHVGGRHVDGHVEIAPDLVEFPTDVGVGVPAVVIVLANARVPLGHAVLDALRIHPSGPANLSRHLGVPLEVDADLLARGDGLGEGEPTDGALGGEFCFGLADPGRVDADPAPLVFGQVHDAVSHASVGIGDVAAAHVHHAFRLEGVEEQMERNAVEGIRAVVDVGQLHHAGILVHIDVHGDVHGAVHFLLPPGVLGADGQAKGEQGKGEDQGKGGESLHGMGKVTVNRPADRRGGRRGGEPRRRSGP